MQPRGLGVDLSECRRAARQEAPKLLAGDPLSPQRSALHLAGWYFLLKDCCASALCHTWFCILTFVIKSLRQGAPQVVLVVENPPANEGDMRVWALVGKIPRRRKWQPTPVFFPGESQRSLVGYSPWGCTESVMSEVTWHACTHISVIFLFVQRETSSGR